MCETIGIFEGTKSPEAESYKFAVDDLVSINGETFVG